MRRRASAVVRDDAELRAGRVRDGREATVRRVLRGPHHAAAELLDPRDRRIGVAHGEVDRPVRRLVAGVGRVVHDPRELPLTLAERRVAELVRVAHRVHVPAEDVAVERDGRLVRAGVELEPGRVPLSPVTSKPFCWFGCQAPTCAPPGSVIIVELPFSPTTIGANSTLPPCLGVAAAIASTSSVMRWTPHASGYPCSPSLRMQPATCLPSFENVK